MKDHLINNEYVISEDLSTKLWQAYDQLFEELNLQSPCMQRAWDKDEFHSAMSDKSVGKTLFKDLNGDVIAVAIWSSNLDLFPWLSQPFFRNKFPEQYNNGQLFYVVAALSFRQNQGYYSEIIHYMSEYIRKQGGRLIFDICDELQKSGWHESIRKISSSVVPTKLSLLGTQTYWTIYEASVENNSQVNG